MVITRVWGLGEQARKGERDGEERRRRGRKEGRKEQRGGKEVMERYCLTSTEF